MRYEFGLIGSPAGGEQRASNPDTFLGSVKQHGGTQGTLPWLPGDPIASKGVWVVIAIASGLVEATGKGRKDGGEEKGQNIKKAYK